MSVFELWLLFTLPSVGEYLAVVAISLGLFSGIFSIVALAVGYENNDDDAKKAGNYLLKKILPIILFCGLLVSFIPSKETMKYMIGGYVVTNIEGVEKLPENVIAAANKFLEEHTEQGSE